MVSLCIRIFHRLQSDMITLLSKNERHRKFEKKSVRQESSNEVDGVAGRRRREGEVIVGFRGCTVGTNPSPCIAIERQPNNG